MSMRRTLLITALVVLAAPSVAHAGGWTTVGLTAPPGDDVRAGGTWTAELNILQHGRTPLEGQKPIVRITAGARSETFVAAPTARTGVYRAAVVFPTGGSWRVSVDHGWGVEHDFGPYVVGGGAGADGGAGAGGAGAGGDGAAGGDGVAGDAGPWVAVIAAVVAGLAAAGVAALVVRRRDDPAATP